jgi:hypothetical protein
MPERKTTTRRRTATTVSPPETRRSPWFVLSLFLGGAAIAGGAVWIGHTDSGKIDVSATIIEATMNSSAEGEPAPAVPLPTATSQLPNGGLIGIGQSTDAVPTVPVSESVSPSTATSTDAATSTESVPEPAATTSPSELDTNPEVTPEAQ